MSLPNTFSPNTKIESAKVNANFNALVSSYSPTAANEDTTERSTTSGTFVDHPWGGISVTTTVSGLIVVSMNGLFGTSTANGGHVRIKTPTGATKLAGGVNYGESDAYTTIGGSSNVAKNTGIVSLFTAPAGSYTFKLEWRGVSGNTVYSKDVSMFALSFVQ